MGVLSLKVSVSLAPLSLSVSELCEIVIPCGLTIHGQHLGRAAQVVVGRITGAGGHRQQGCLVVVLNVVFKGSQGNGLGHIPVTGGEGQVVWKVADLGVICVVVRDCDRHVVGGWGVEHQRDRIGGCPILTDLVV